MDEIASPTASAAPEPAPPPDGMIRHRLRKPITVPGDAKTPKIQLSELVMREPTGGDIARYGNPVRFNPFVPDGERAEITFDEAKMTAMIAGLAAVPPVALADMDPQDWVGAAWKLAGFFLPAG